MEIKGISLTYPRLLVVGLLVTTCIAGVYAASTSGTAFGSYNPNWDGSREVRLLAEASADTTIAQSTQVYTAGVPSNSTAVIFSPQTSYSEAAIIRIRQFVRQGGTLVVAEDFRPYTNQLLAGIGVTSRIDGRLLRDERFYYRTPAFPIAQNVTGPFNESVVSITFNHGSVVQPGSNATVLVRSSEYGYLDSNRNSELDESETLRGYPVVVSEGVAEGRVIIVSDPSMFINTMLDQSSNRAFATYVFSLNERVVLDYSHTSGVPLLAGLVLVLRSSALAQIIVSGGIVLVAWGALKYDVGSMVSQSERPQVEPLSTGEIQAVIQDAHPQWSADRVERVARSIRESEESSVDD